MNACFFPLKSACTLESSSDFFDRRRNQCKRSNFDTFTTDSIDNRMTEIFEKKDALLVETKESYF